MAKASSKEAPIAELTAVVDSNDASFSNSAITVPASDPPTFVLVDSDSYPAMTLPAVGSPISAPIPSPDLFITAVSFNNCDITSINPSADDFDELFSDLTLNLVHNPPASEQRVFQIGNSSSWNAMLLEVLSRAALNEE